MISHSVKIQLMSDILDAFYHFQEIPGNEIDKKHLRCQTLVGFLLKMLM